MRGWMICMFRCALICFTKSGISRMRMTTTRPTIEKVQVQPLVDGIPMAVRIAWNWTRIQLTPVPIQSMMNTRAPRTGGTVPPGEGIRPWSRL